jgi:flagellar biogenesis protein FliO
MLNTHKKIVGSAALVRQRARSRSLAVAALLATLAVAFAAARPASALLPQGAPTTNQPVDATKRPATQPTAAPSVPAPAASPTADPAASPAVSPAVSPTASPAAGTAETPAATPTVDARTGPLAPPPTRPLVPSFSALLELEETPRANAEPVVIPTELEPGTPIPPTRRAARPVADESRAAGGSGDASQRTASALSRSTARGAGDGSLAAGADSGSTLMDQVVPTALALGGTIAAIFLMRFVVKRFGGGIGGAFGKAKRPSGVVEVLARYPFARGHHIVLIKVGRRVLVTHQSAQGIQTLSEFSSPGEVADLIARCEAGARGTDQFSFDSLLRANDREFDAPRQQPVLLGQDRKPAPRATRPATGVREALPPAARTAEIETIDLTKRRGVLR